MPRQANQLLAGGRVPQSDRAISAAGRDARPVRAVNGGERLAGVTTQGPQFLTRIGLPFAYGPVQGRSQKSRTIGTKNYGGDFLGMSEKSRSYGIRVRIAHKNVMGPRTRRGEQSPIGAETDRAALGQPVGAARTGKRDEFLFCRQIPDSDRAVL